MRPRPEDWRFDLDGALDAVVLAARRDPGGRVHRADPRHRARRQRRGDPRRRPGPHHRLPHHRGEHHLAHHQQGHRGRRLSARLRPGHRLRPGAAARQARREADRARQRRLDAASARTWWSPGHGGRAHALKATVFAKREFAGYWEYVLDEAMFTAPAHPQWGGAALDRRRRQARSASARCWCRRRSTPARIQGNMIVPIDLLAPILDDMTEDSAAPTGAPRPWLGMYATEAGERLVVAGLAPGAPAERAGVQRGRRGDRGRRRRSRRASPTCGARSGRSAPAGADRPAQARCAAARRSNCASPPPTATTSSRNRTCTNSGSGSQLVYVVRGQGRNSSTASAPSSLMAMARPLRCILPGDCGACHSARRQSRCVFSLRGGLPGVPVQSSAALDTSTGARCTRTA